MSAPSSPGEAMTESASRSAETIAQRARACRILQQPAEHLSAVEIDGGIADDKPPAQRLGAGAQHAKRLRVHLVIDKESLRLHLRDALGERHRFGRGGCLIEQRGVGDIEAGEITDHGLEVEQGFQPALADLGLIGRVGRVPGRVLQDVALDHRGQDGAGIALADQRGKGLVLRCELAHMRERLGLAQRRAEIERRLLWAASPPSAPTGWRRRPSPASR